MLAVDGRSSINLRLIDMATNLKLILVRLTEDARATLETLAGGPGKLTAALKSVLANAEKAPLRGDSKARLKSMSVRLPISMVEDLDRIAKARACSRNTLINSCIALDPPKRQRKSAAVPA